MMTTKHRFTTRQGTTITELAVAVLIASVALAGIGAMLAEGHRNWSRTYNRAYGNVPTGTDAAIRSFDAIVRKAQAEGFLLDEAGKWIETHYYANDTSTAPDRYALIYVSQGELKVEYGQLDPRSAASTQTICQNVSSCTFKQVGRSVQMLLTLDDGTQTRTAVTSGFMHNQ